MKRYLYNSPWLHSVIRAAKVGSALNLPLPLVTAPARERGKSERYHGPKMARKRNDARGKHS